VNNVQARCPSLVYQCFRGLAPAYLAEAVQVNVKWTVPQ